MRPLTLGPSPARALACAPTLVSALARAPEASGEPPHLSSLVA